MCKDKVMNDNDIFRFLEDPDAQQNGDQYAVTCYPTEWKLSCYPTVHTLDSGETTND